MKNSTCSVRSAVVAAILKHATFQTSLHKLGEPLGAAFTMEGARFFFLRRGIVFAFVFGTTADQCTVIVPVRFRFDFETGRIGAIAFIGCFDPAFVAQAFEPLVKDFEFGGEHGFKFDRVRPRLAA